MHGLVPPSPRWLSSLVRSPAANGSATGGCACRVRPASASPRAAGEVISASWPVARTNSTARLDLRPHRAGRQLREQRLGLVRRELAQLLLPVRAEAGEHRGHLGQDHEPVGAERAREEGGGAVLVDHRVDAREVLAAARGRDAAAADRDDDRPRGEQRADRARARPPRAAAARARPGASRGRRRGRPASRGRARARAPAARRRTARPASSARRRPGRPRRRARA